MTKTILTWAEARALAIQAATRIWKSDKIFAPPADMSSRLKVYGVPRGGVCAAMLLPEQWEMVENPEQADVIMDDIIDSGATKARFEAAFPNKHFEALVTCYRSVAESPWYVFPWETDEPQGGEENVRRLLQLIGEDPDREGLAETPSRFIKALRELTCGTKLDPLRHLSKTFAIESPASPEMHGYDGAILSRSIPFVSLCEHHLLPFFGVAHIGYIPDVDQENSRVVGLSKLARCFEDYARRLQIQERLTAQVASAIQSVLKPKGVALIVKGKHTCQCFRGANKDGDMVTSSMLGVFRDNPAARAEFISLLSI